MVPQPSKAVFVGLLPDNSKYNIGSQLASSTCFLLPVQIAANDEICKSFAESGGVTALQQLLCCATEDGPPELVRSSAAALRQLANSDGIKQQLAEAGVLDTIMR